MSAGPAMAMPVPMPMGPEPTEVKMVNGKPAPMQPDFPEI
jgi:hypothetical protein